MSYIELVDINKNYGEKTILNKLNMSIEKGELISLLGSSGSGKSTVLRIISGLESPTSGDVFINNQNVTRENIRKRNIGMIFQNYTLFPTMTVFENIAFSLKLKKAPKDFIEDKVNGALSLVSMTGHENKFPSQLSGGEQQRVSIARVLVNENKILLFDEPFSSIDAKLRKDLQVKIRELHDDLNLTTIFVTHDQEEALLISDKIFLLADGDIIQQGPPNELYKYPKNLYTANFMGNHNIIEMDGDLVAIKAENIKIISSDEKNTATSSIYLEGVIENIFIKGSIIEFRINTNFGEIKVELLNSLEKNYNLGERVTLNISKEDIIIFN